MAARRGLDISYETVRRCVAKFGPRFAPGAAEAATSSDLAVAPGRNGRSDRGQAAWLWRVVDDDGEVLDVLVQSRRDMAAAVRLLRKLIRKQRFAPEAITSDKLASYGAAIRQRGLSGPTVPAFGNSGLRLGASRASV